MKMKTLFVAIAVTMLAVSFAGCGEEAKPEELSYISGTVYEKVTHSPISGAVVSLGDQTATTTSDGRYIFAKLEKGSINTIQCVKSKFKDAKIENVVAVYPNATQDIELEIYVPEKPAPMPVKTITMANLKSFDYVLNFGVSPDQITYEMNGSFSAPNSYSYAMKQYKQQQVQVGPDDAKKESPPVKIIEIAGQQWIDEGNGYTKVEPNQIRVGFKDMFNMMQADTEILTKAFASVQNCIDDGAVTIGSINCRRYKGLTVYQVQRPVFGENHSKTMVNDMALCDFNIALATDKGIENAPVDIEMTLYFKDNMVRTYTHFTVNNINKEIVISPPDVKGPANNVPVTPTNP